MSQEDSSLKICAPNRKRDFDAILDMTGRVFRPEHPEGWVRYCKAGYITGSSYDWSASRVAFVDGELASHVGVWGLNLRIGKATIPFGGIGAVGTLKDYRGRGIASEVMTAIMQAMHDQGYALSCMFGRGQFYDRYGYFPIYPRSYAMLKSWRNEGPKPKLTMQREDVSVLLKAEGEIGRIYQRQRKLLSLTADRPVYTKNRYDNWVLHKFMDASGKIRAYMAVAIEGENLLVHELGGFETPAARQELLAQILAMTKQYGCAGTKLVIPRTHPMMPLLKRMYCDYHEAFYTDGWAMAAVVNLTSAIKCLKPELAARVKNSKLAGKDFAINLKVAGQQAAIVNKSGSLKVYSKAVEGGESVEGSDMIRLLLGSEPPREVLEAGKMAHSAKAAELLEVLMPFTDPMIPNAEYH